MALVSVPALTKTVLAMTLGVRCRTLTRRQLFTDNLVKIVGSSMRERIRLVTSVTDGLRGTWDLLNFVTLGVAIPNLVPARHLIRVLYRRWPIGNVRSSMIRATCLYP